MQTVTLIECTASAIAGGGVTYGWMKYVWPNRHQTYTWIFKLRPHHRIGQSCPTDLVLKRDGYCLGFSYERKCALWASFIISKESVGIDMERAEKFYADPAVPEKYRVKPEDFTNTGYDKGHLAPSAAIDFSRQSNDQTFAMSNVALQHPKLNRHAWGALEGIIRGWTNTKGMLGVVVGPTYNKSPKKVNDIPVPAGFYQVVYSYKHRKSIGFLFPNDEVPAANLWDHVKSVADIEKETGYKFFSNVGWILSEEAPSKDKLDLPFWKTK